MARPEGRWLHVTSSEPDAPIDVAASAEVLSQIGDSPSEDIFEVGHQLIALSETLPNAGRQGVFDWSYGNLTLNIGHAIHHRRQRQYEHYPEFEDPETVMHTAGIFAGYDFDANVQMVKYYQAETAEERRQIYNAMRPHWRFMKFATVPEDYDHVVPVGPNREIENSHNVQKFGIGMINHIIAEDLGDSMVKSGVPESYLVPPSRRDGVRGGDYYMPVNTMIKYTAQDLAPYMVAHTGNNERLVRASMSPVSLIIAGFRQYKAIPNYEKLVSLQTEEAREAARAEMNDFALDTDMFFAKYGEFALQAYDVFTLADRVKGGPVFARFRKEQKQKRLEEQRKATGAA